MKVYRGFSKFEALKGSVLTIGHFDGCHLGHQEIIKTLIEKAKRLKLPSVVMTFEPLAQEYFNPRLKSQRIYSLREKLRAFQSMGVNAVIVLAFNELFAKMSAQQFMHTILHERLRVKHLVIGHDFSFGHDRQGNEAFLQRFAHSLGFKVQSVPPYLFQGQRLSSTQVRCWLAQGQFDTLAQALGRPYAVQGRVIHGQKRGRLMGIPTANFRPKVFSLRGVFLVCMHWENHGPYWGVANWGLRPTFKGTHPQLEVHLFEISADLYHKKCTVTFKAKIRSEKTFENRDALIDQIHQDIVCAKTLVGRYTENPTDDLNEQFKQLEETP